MTAKKKVITLDSDKLHGMLWDIEWNLAEKTQELINLLKENEMKRLETQTVKALENLLEKRYNVMSAQCIIYDEEEK
jgi:hypothetical protein